MHRIFAGLFWILLVLYLLALAVFAVGTLALFGQPASPLSGIFLIPLGFPWFLIADSLPDAIGPYILALAPIVNLAILRWLAQRTLART